MNYSMSEKEREEVEGLSPEAQERYHAMRAAGNSHSGAMNHSKRNPADLEKEAAVIDARTHFGPYITTDKITGLPSVNFPSPLPIELARTIRDLPENTLRRILNSQSLRLGMATKRIIKGIMDEMRRNGASRKKSVVKLAPAKLEDRNQALKDAYSGLANDPANIGGIDEYMSDGYNAVNNYLRRGVYEARDREYYSEGGYESPVNGKKPSKSVIESRRKQDEAEAKGIVDRTLETMDRFTSSVGLPFEMNGYRVMGADVLNGAKVGDVITDSGYTSVTHNPDLLDMYVGDQYGALFSGDEDIAVMNIKMPEGTKGGYLSALDPDNSSYGIGDAENEFVLARGSKFKIKSMRKEGKQTVYEVEVIQP